MADITREKKAKVDITFVDEEGFKEGKVGKWSKRKLSKWTWLVVSSYSNDEE